MRTSSSARRADKLEATSAAASINKKEEAQGSRKTKSNLKRNKKTNQRMISSKYRRTSQLRSRWPSCLSSRKPNKRHLLRKWTRRLRQRPSKRSTTKRLNRTPLLRSKKKRQLLTRRKNNKIKRQQLSPLTMTTRQRINRLSSPSPEQTVLRNRLMMKLKRRNVNEKRRLNNFRIKMKSRPPWNSLSSRIVTSPNL